MKIKLDDKKMHNYTSQGGKYYYTTFDLKQRGWTDTSIDRFLDKYDELLPVNHFRNFYGKCAYLKDRVNAAEQTDLFEIFFIKSSKRRKIKKKFIKKVINEVIHNNYESRESDLYFEDFSDDSPEIDADKIVEGVARLVKIMYCSHCKSTNTTPILSNESKRFCKDCKKEYLYTLTE